jgi:hypothetical protein
MKCIAKTKLGHRVTTGDVTRDRYHAWGDINAKYPMISSMPSEKLDKPSSTDRFINVYRLLRRGTYK